MEQCIGQKTQLSLKVSGYSKEREAHVMSRLIGDLVHKPMSVVIEQKSLEENVGTHLLQRFDEESEEDEQPISTQVVSDVPVAVQKVADKGKKAWGPIQATRMSSRIARDGKSAIEKAQELKKTKNLEAPKGKSKAGFNNSFAALANDSLLAKAADAGISLGDTREKAEINVNKIKDVEIDRLDRFHVSNPDMFLPTDISLTVDEMLGPNKDSHVDGKSHISVESERYHDSYIVMSMMRNMPGLRCVEKDLVERN
jgi:hypothetical protein